MTPRLACTIVLGLGIAWLSGCHRTPPIPPIQPPPTVKEGANHHAASDRTRSAPPALRISPEAVTLKPGDPGWQLLVEGIAPAGTRRDMTREVAWEVEPAGVVSVGDDGYLLPLGPGRATVRAVRGGDLATAVVTVPAPADRPWDFAADVAPILSRAGCNAASCHGRPGGQNGFHLSLFGTDPKGDFRALAQEADGRRIALDLPEESLFLLKGTGQVPHKGGQRLSPGSVEESTLLAWVEARAPEHQGPTHGPLVRLEVDPSAARLAEPGPLQLRVLAHYADGHARDVTRLAIYSTKDDSAARIEPDGHATLLRRDETDLIVRYQTEVVSARLATAINPDLEFDFAGPPRQNLIDEKLFQRLASLKVPPSPPAEDAVFLRRVTLDLTGRQPRPDEIRAFLKDTDPDKRTRLVDRLLASPGFTRFWRIKLGDLLQITSARFQGGAGYYFIWLDDRLARNVPWDQMVRDLLTAVGDPMSIEGGAANYALEGADPKTQAELTAQRFLGLRLRCAQCHDHPFDVWTQDDYYGLAAFFAQVERAGRPGFSEVRLNPEGRIEHPRTHQPVAPRLPGGETSVISPGDDPRRALADWITRPDNPFFARALVNWTWAQLFGRGLADPADDLSRANPPVHPELLDALARHFVSQGYDLRALVRTIATSEAYGLSSAPVPGNEPDTRLFSHQSPRPLTAHQMADSLAQATGVPNAYRNHRPEEGRTSLDILDPSEPSTLLDTLGRCPRTDTCSPSASPPLSLRQVLFLIGGGLIDEKVSHLHGYLSSLLDLPGLTTDEAVENLYLRTLCRPPKTEELSHWQNELDSAPDLREAAEDLFWALLNSREFAFNH